MKSPTTNQPSPSRWRGSAAWLAVTAAALLSMLPALGQSTFTRITTGPIATEGKYSNRGVWLDYDNDGDLDLFVANGGFDYPLPAKANYLYRNDGSGIFTNITTGVLVEDVEQSISGAWGDYDNDGKLDLFVANLGAAADESLYRNSLYRNLGSGTFSKITSTPLDKDGGYHRSGSWADYDNDGNLDLLAVSWGSPRLLYHHNGDGTFERITGGPVVTNVTAAVGAVWADYDGDGDQDVLVLNSEGAGPVTAVRNSFYRNEGGGMFTPITTGPFFNELSQHFNSAVWGDYDNDGDLDVYVCYGWSDGPNFLFQNNGDGTFLKIIGGVEVSLGAMAAAWGDYDNDGYLDLFTACGMLGNRLYHNNGDGSFTRIATGPGSHTGYYSLGCDWGDYDNDGFLDLFVANGTVDPNQPTQLNNFLYHNDGNTNRWLKVKLVGTVSNRAAIGAKVRVLASLGGTNRWQLREVSVGCNYSGHNLLPHFGLGDATNVDLVRIEWPSGNVQELANVAPNQSIMVTEATLITPTRPSASLNGSVTLTRSVVSGATYQWRLDGVDLVGQTSRYLNLMNITADMAGRYSVVASNATALITNYVNLHVDTQFTKITEGPLVTDLGTCWSQSIAGDYNGDGFEDIFVTRYNRGLTSLYQNNQDGTFTRISTPPSQPTVDTWSACAWGDFDNDGALDLLAIRDQKTSYFYWNSGSGTFTSNAFDVLSPWNVAVADYDRDGRLDLYFSYASLVPNRLYRNLGDRAFQRKHVSVVGPVASDYTFGGAAWADYDDDGWPDLCAPDHKNNRIRMYHNERTGRFTAVNNLVTGSGAALACAWGDCDNDGRLDLLVVRFNGTSQLYRNLDNGVFAAGPLSLTGKYNGASWADYDNDGSLDLFVSGYGGSPNVLFHNNGDGSFTKTSTGSIVTDLPVGSPTAGSYWGTWFDYDNNGFLDLYVVNGDDNATVNTANFLYRNNGNSNAWLKVKLIGTTSNRDAVGAKVRVRANYAGAYRWQRRDITGGDAINGAQSYAHFGLGNAAIASTVRIEWPSGAVQELANVAANQILAVYEPPAMAAAVRADGACELTIKAEPNRGWQIQASSDLLTWQTVTTLTNTSYQFQFTDPAAAGMNCRFYRVESK